MKKKDFIKNLLLGGAVQCDIGIDSVYVTRNKVNDSEIYIYIKRSDALDIPFFGIQDSILQYLHNKDYLVVLLDGKNNKTYILDKQQVSKIVASRSTNKSGAYLVYSSDLNEWIDCKETMRFFTEEIAIF